MIKIDIEEILSSLNEISLDNEYILYISDLLESDEVN